VTEHAGLSAREELVRADLVIVTAVAFSLAFRFTIMLRCSGLVSPLDFDWGWRA